MPHLLNLFSLSERQPPEFVLFIRTATNQINNLQTFRTLKSSDATIKTRSSPRLQINACMHHDAIIEENTEIELALNPYELTHAISPYRKLFFCSME